MANNSAVQQGNTHVGTERDETIDGGAGNQYIDAKGGQDTVYGGIGSDNIEGGSGDDMLYGDDAEVSFVPTTLITAAEDGEMTVTFNYEEAGYKNTFGVYKVDPETGEIYDVEIIWDNASLQGSGGDLIADESNHTIDVEAGDQVGFFIISNGYNANNQFKDMQEGTFEFRDGNGDPATLSSTAPNLVHVAPDGAETAVKNPVFHTAAYGDNVKMNPDDLLHTTGLLDTGAGTIQLGFEDLWKGGDKDYDDAVFTVEIGQSTAQVLNAHFQESNEIGNEDLIVGNKYSKMNPHDTVDSIQGQQGDDTIDGMQGNDLLSGGGVGAEWALENGEWVYKGTSEGEAVASQDGDDVIVGGSGHDVLLGGAGDDELSGGDGRDTLNAGLGDDTLDGGAGDDTINAEAGNDTASGGDGNDIINAGAGDDIVSGGDGDDQLRGGEGRDTLDGDKGQDTIHGHEGDDTIRAGDGNDSAFGGEGADTIEGGAGQDHLDGGIGADSLSGGADADTLMGGADGDTLSGGAGTDKLIGGTGADRIEGGAGNDHLWGGEWAGDQTGDTFVMQAGTGQDMVHDFEVAHDQIDLTAYGVDFAAVKGALVDEGWATVLDLSKLGADSAGDKLILKDVQADDLSEKNFVL